MLNHYAVAMTTGTPVKLSTAIDVGEAADRQLAAVWMQPRADNAAVIYIGGDATMSSTDYGVRLEAPAAGIPPAPFNPGEFSQSRGAGNKSPIRLDDIWALGSTNDELHLLVLWY